MGVDQVDALRRPAPPQPGGDDAHEADQAAGLLESGVFLEAGVEVADRGVEGIGLGHPGGELLGGGVGHVHLAGVTHGLGIGLGDLGDVVLPRQFLEDALAQDLVELVRVHAHRLQAHGGAPGLLVQVAEGLDDLLAAAGVGGGEIGDDQADVGQFVLADGDQEVGQGCGGDHREVGVADGLGSGVLEIGW